MAVFALAIVFGAWALGLSAVGVRASQWFSGVRATPAAALRPMAQPGEILIVGVRATDRQRISLTVNPRGYRPICVESVEQGLARLRYGGDFQAVVFDGEVAGAATLARLLRSTMEERHVIELSRSLPRERLGPLLLNAL